MFRGCRSADAFVKIFSDHAFCQQQVQSEGTISTQSITSRSPPPPPASSSPTGNSQPPAKRVRVAAMVPASHTARQSDQQEDGDDTYDTKKMDKEILEYFEGM